MKHLRLLLASLAIAIGGGNLFAQTWTGSAVGEGTYYLYNVGADKFVAYGLSWGTQAIVDEVGIPMTLESSNGKYTIKTNVNSGNGKYYLGSGFFVDQVACDFTFYPVEGKTNVYNISYMDGETEKFRMWVTGAKGFDQISSVSAGATWTLESTQWMLISQEERDAKFAAGDPLDITYKFINDPNTSYFSNIYDPAQSWTSGSWGMESHNKDGAWRDKCGEVWNANYDVYKTIENVPNGTYRFSVQGFYRDGWKPSESFAANAKLYANDAIVDVQSVTVGVTEAGLGGSTIEAAGGYIPDSREAACYYFQADKYPFQSVEVLVTDHTLKFGVKKETLISGDWTVVDKFRLNYVEPTIDVKAVVLPDNGAMEADTWYYFDIATDGDYTLTATDLTTIVNTTEGNSILFSNEASVTATFGSDNQNLTAGRYYVKSSSANNLVVTAKSYTYIVGTPTTSIADGETVTTLTTFLATFNDAATNDIEASFTILNADAKAQLTEDGSVVAEGTLALDGKVLTATFPETTLENGAAYVLSIAAGVVGYAGQASNEAVSINIVTPAVADGYYFLRDAQGRYVGRGSWYNTRAHMEAFGLPLHVQTNNEGITTFTFIDSNLNLFDAGEGTVYTDNTTNPNWKVEATDGGYYIINKNNNGSYDKKLGTDGGTWLQSNADGLVWTFEPAAEHNTYMEALKDAQANEAATAAGIDAENVAALKAALEADYAEEPVEIETVAWAEKYQVSAGTEGAGNGVKYYEKSVSGLKPGLYKLTANAFYRLTWNGTVDAAAGARGNVYLYGNDAKTQLFSVFDFPADAAWVSGNDYQDANGKFYPNNPTGAQAAFAAGNYENELFVYVVADDGEETGTLKYGIHQPSRFPAKGQWCGYQNFKLTYYSDDVAKAEDYEALNQALETAEAKTLGFEADEYAPYNNVEAIKAIAKAKEVNQEIKNSKSYVNSLTADLSGGWTANTEEVNAVYDGTLANATIQATSDNVVLTGWTTVSGNTRQTFKGTGEDGKACLADAIDQVGVFVHPGTYRYGETTGYTMPLKGGKTYRAEAKYCAWQNESNNNFTLTIKKGDDVVETKSYGANGTDVTVEGALKQVFLYFTPETDGDYVLDVVANGNTFMTDFIIKLAVAEDVTIDEAEEEYVPAEAYANVTFKRTLVEGWNGLVLPFDMTVEDAKTVFSATAVKDFTGVTYEDGKGATLVFSDATEIKAGKPFLVKAAAGTEYKIEGVMIKTDALQAISQADETESAKYTMTGTYKKVDLSDVDFVLIQGTKYYEHNTGKSSSAKAFRAYFVNESTEEAAKYGLNIDLDGDATGITLVEDTQNVQNGKVYNLQGQQVNAAQKGVYIVNGKKIVKH